VAEPIEPTEADRVRANKWFGYYRQREHRDALAREYAEQRAAGRAEAAREHSERIAELKDHLTNCVTAMELWGSWEDGIPEPGVGEHGFVGNTYEAAKEELGLVDGSRERMADAIKHGHDLRMLAKLRASPQLKYTRDVLMGAKLKNEDGELFIQGFAPIFAQRAADLTVLLELLGEVNRG
jgi:hypothetical protein